jgi:mono/diheme cytochrome c family protein
MTVKVGQVCGSVVVAFLITVLGLGGIDLSAETPEAEKPATDQVQETTPHVAVESSNPMSGKPEAIEAGKKLYYKWCTACHGPKADGVSRFGSYAADLRQFWRGYKEFVVIVKNGRPEKQMPPWKEVLDETQIAQIGAFLETLTVEGAVWK